MTHSKGKPIKPYMNRSRNGFGISNLDAGRVERNKEMKQEAADTKK